MENPAERFERLFQRWRSACRTGVRTLSSSDSAYIENPEFEAIVSMGQAAVPHIMAKLQVDEDAHFLIHALEEITGKQFTQEEIEAAERRFGRPIGNQGYAQMWSDWWKREGKK